jgi:hypothetical protein
MTTASDAIQFRMVQKAARTTGHALFSVIRDEVYLLPHFLDYYRRLGIETFLFYDDRSGPETREILSRQADCTVIASDHAFGDAFGDIARDQGPRRLNAALKESLPQQAFPDRWVLTADADEFLVLPPPFQSIGELTDHLSRVGQFYLTAPMVDFYPPTLNGRNHAHGLSPFEGSPHFDVGPYYDWIGPSCVPRPAGIRYRLQKLLQALSPAEYRAIYGDSLAGPINWKAPLLKNGQGIYRIGDHELNIAPSDRIAGVLAHFKFCPGLDDKVARALGEGQYTQGSLHYRFIDAALRRLGDTPLACDLTRTFDGPQALVAANLLTSL